MIPLLWDLHGLVLETSIWLLAGSTRFLVRETISGAITKTGHECWLYCDRQLDPNAWIQAIISSSSFPDSDRLYVAQTSLLTTPWNESTYTNGNQGLIHWHKAWSCYGIAFEPDSRLLSVNAATTNTRSIASRHSILCQWQIVNPAEHNRSLSGCDPEGCWL